MLRHPFCAVLIVILLAFTTAGRAAPSDAHAAKAGESIKKAIAYLRSTQAADGSWNAKPGPAVTGLVLAVLLDQPLEIEGHFDFTHRYRASSEPMSEEHHTEDGAGIHDRLFRGERVRAESFWIQPSTLADVLQAGTLGHGTSARPSLALRVMSTGEARLEVEGVPEGTVGDVAWEAAEDMRRTWAVVRSIDDDGTSFVLNGLPGPAAGSLVADFTGHISSGVASRVRLSCQGKEIVMLSREGDDLVLRAVRPASTRH